MLSISSHYSFFSCIYHIYISIINITKLYFESVCFIIYVIWIWYKNSLEQAKFWDWFFYCHAWNDLETESKWCLFQNKITNQNPTIMSTSSSTNGIECSTNIRKTTTTCICALIGASFLFRYYLFRATLQNLAGAFQRGKWTRMKLPMTVQFVKWVTVYVIR